MPVIALATRNPGKVDEIKAGLNGRDVDILSVDDFPGFPDVLETESTLEGNAALKSLALFAFSGVASLADDTGLEVDALNGDPGVRSARYAGEDCVPADNRKLLLKNLEGRSDRGARFRTVLSFTDASGTRLFEGTCRGKILLHERGTGGFGYDSIFQPDGSEQSFAEMSTEQKNRLSHRGIAVRKFFDFMQTYSVEE